MRPLRPLAPFFASVAVVAGWWTIAHSGGQGWVQDLGDLVFAGLAVGLLGPAAHLATTRPLVLSCPADGQAGQPLELTVLCRRRLRVRPIEPAGAEQFVGPTSINGGGSHLVLLPRNRGVYRSIRVQVASAAPFGLQWWGRVVTLEIPAPLHIAPRPGMPLPAAVTEADGGGVAARSGRLAGAGELRGTRTYAPGDERRHVHWPATAHTGQVMVRELERLSASPAHLKVRLPADPDEAEAMAGAVLGTVLKLLAAGRPTILDTLEEGGPVSGPVAGHRDAGRRLAASRPGRVTAASAAPVASQPEP